MANPRDLNQQIDYLIKAARQPRQDSATTEVMKDRVAKQIVNQMTDAERLSAARKLVGDRNRAHRKKAADWLERFLTEGAQGEIDYESDFLQVEDLPLRIELHNTDKDGNPISDHWEVILRDITVNDLATWIFQRKKQASDAKRAIEAAATGGTELLHKLRAGGFRTIGDWQNAQTPQHKTA